MSKRFLVVALSPVWIGCVFEDVSYEGADDVGESRQEVIGGSAAAIGQSPWQARLTNDGSHWCGGSLIGSRWILTAGHCVSGQSPDDLAVVLGDLHVDRFDANEQIYAVRRFIIHPGYGYDVALVELGMDVALNASVQPVALQRAPASSTGHTVSGWGWTVGGAYQSSEVLMYATLPVVPNAKCNSAPLTRDLLENEMCAGFVDGVRGAAMEIVGVLW